MLYNFNVHRCWGPQSTYESVDRAIVGLAAEYRSTGEVGTSGGTFSRAASRKVGDLDLLPSDDWPGVPAAAVLLPPDRCRTIWRQFFTESARTVQQAVAVQVGLSLI